MKKVLIFLGIMIVLFIALALLTNMGNSKKASENNPYEKDRLRPATIDLLDDKNYQNIILPEKLEKKLANQEDATVYFFASDCPFCKEATPILTPMSEELGIDLVQYNLLEFKQGWNDYNIESTPTIVQFKDGEEVARIVGLQEEDAYRRWLTDNHVQ